MFPKIYFVRVIMDPDKVAGLSSWYKSRHAGDLINVGFHAVHHHLALDATAQVCNVYEIPGVEVFGDAYETSQHNDDNLQTNIGPASMGASTQTVCSQLAVSGMAAGAAAAGDRPSFASSPGAPVIAPVRFDLSPADENGIEVWFEGPGLADLSRRGGFVRARLLRRDEAQHPHALHPTEPCRYLVLTEWADQGSGLAYVESQRAHGLPGLEPSTMESSELFRNDLSVRNPSTWGP